MSHEIRTPMNGLIGTLDTELAGPRREYPSVAQVSADSPLALINDILDFSTIEADKLGLELVTFDLLQEVEMVANVQALMAQDKRIDLIVSYPPHLPRSVVGDPARIGQVLVNLVSNAVKFTASGHVRIEVDVDGLPGTRGRVRVAVTDTGIGLAPDQVDAIFEKFTQADSTTTRKYGGTGLGLTICKLLVELMGGEIGVFSKPGNGSTFWFALDLMLGPAPTGAAATLPSPLVGVRMLVADPHPANRTVMQEQLTRLAVRADCLGTAAAALDALALARLEDDPYTVLILDQNLPDIDGETTAMIVKADPLYHNTLLVLLSSLVNVSEQQRWAHAGFSGVLCKPVPQYVLINTLTTLCAPAREPAHADSAPGGATRPARTVPTAASLAQPYALSNHKLCPFDGRQILVVDDNVVNLDVAVNMLDKLGCRSRTAANGRIAVEMASSAAYDLILMDCQMPELDGYQATTDIRRIEGADRHTTIVALTAHALDAEREKCIQCGMDDFLSKPIRALILRDMLARWLTPSASAFDTAPEVPLPDEDPMEATRKMFGANFAKLASVFRSDSPKRLEALRAAARARDVQDIERVAHAFSGSTGSVGASALSHLCKQLETAARSGALVDLEQRIAAIEEAYAKIDAKLVQMVQTDEI